MEWKLNSSTGHQHVGIIAGALTPFHLLAIIQSILVTFSGFYALWQSLNEQWPNSLPSASSTSYSLHHITSHCRLTFPSTSKCATAIFMEAHFCHHSHTRALSSLVKRDQEMARKKITSFPIFNANLIFIRRLPVGSFAWLAWDRQAWAQWKLHLHYFYGSYFSVIMFRSIGCFGVWIEPLENYDTAHKHIATKTWHQTAEQKKKHQEQSANEKRKKCRQIMLSVTMYVNVARRIGNFGSKQFQGKLICWNGAMYPNNGSFAWLIMPIWMEGKSGKLADEKKKI